MHEPDITDDDVPVIEARNEEVTFEKFGVRLRSAVLDYCLKCEKQGHAEVPMPLSERLDAFLDWLTLEELQQKENT